MFEFFVFYKDKFQIPKVILIFELNDEKSESTKY